MTLIERVNAQAVATPDRTALEGNGEHLSYARLAAAIETLASQLRDESIRVLGLAMDNRPSWAVIDIAAMAVGITVVPLPPFFSPAQIQHALSDAGVDTVISDDAEAFLSRVGGDMRASAFLDVEDTVLTRIETGLAGDKVPVGIAKITYTSGTTADPKGVMLAWQHIEPVVRDLAGAVGVRGDDHLLALNPLAVLLENIGSIYVALWSGATVLLPSLRETGLLGAAGIDGARMTALLRDTRAATAIFMPQTLLAVTETLERDNARLPDLRFAAVGGAPVSPRLLARSSGCDLPVFEGYGMSECASVMTLNTATANRPGSVGRPLPHTRLRITADGEVEVFGATSAGYLGHEAASNDDWWGTGDLGHFDADGFLYLQGRRRNCFITAFGRNVAPEWVEKELTLEPAIAQAAVFGEARAVNIAVLVPAPGADMQAITAAVQRANSGLPDYARVTRWVIADEAFTPANGQFTGTGRVRREAVQVAYADAIESLYKQESPT